MAIEVNIVNDVIEFVQKDSIISIILALSTFALVIITIIGLWRTNVLTRKSNDELKKSNVITERMLELTHRPILKLNYVNLWWKKDNENTSVNTHIMLRNSSDTKKTHLTIKFKLTNMGIESAQNIMAGYRLDFLNNDDDIDVNPSPYVNNFSTMGPTNNLKFKNFDLDLPASHDEEYEISDEFDIPHSTKCIFTFEISFNFLGDSEGYIQYIYVFTGTNYKILFRNHIS